MPRLSATHPPPPTYTNYGTRVRDLQGVTVGRNTPPSVLGAWCYRVKADGCCKSVTMCNTGGNMNVATEEDCEVFARTGQ